MMPAAVSEFLRDAGWEDAAATPLAADFSSRRFTRLERRTADPNHAVLMQATPNQKTPEFAALAALLRHAGLSAPMIYAVDEAQGLVLMEDFGDATFGALMDAGQAALPLYHRATDVLVQLHRTTAHASTGRPGLPVFNADAFTAQAELFLDFYFPRIQRRAATSDERERFRDAWQTTLKPLEAVPQTLMLRDYMPDNLMDLPEREGFRSVGLLDFQDGGIGPVAYDIASLCECVRRDVHPALLDDITAYYHVRNPVMPLDELRLACRILSAQRHVRVLGIVARLAQEQGRRDKLALMPRIHHYLDCLLREKPLAPLHTWVADTAPTPPALKK